MSLGKTRGFFYWLARLLRGAKAKPEPTERKTQGELQAGEAQEQPLDVLEIFQEAARLEPNDAEARLHLGIAYGELGRDEETLRAFEEAIRLKPDFVRAYGALGAAYVKLGRHQEAVEAFKEAIRLTRRRFG